MEQKSYWNYWGKADPNYRDEPKWHPLVYHSLDAAACALTLSKKHPKRIEVLSQSSGLDGDKLLPWLTFLAAIHDLGKFADDFQWKRDDIAEQQQQRRSTAPASKHRHDTLGYIFAREYLISCLGFDGADEDLREMIRPWLAAVTGHHGTPPTSVDGAKLVLRDQFPRQVVIDAWDFIKAVAMLTGMVWPLPTAPTGLEARRYQHASWLLAGLTVAADWLGSNTRWFKYKEPDLSLRKYWEEVALPQAERAVEESGLVPAKALQSASIGILFPRIATQATALQRWAEHVPIDEGPQLFLMEELTGGGKTEAALTLAARLTAAGCGQGIYLALPTMATADAMFDRIRYDPDNAEPWRRFFADGNAQLALAHSTGWVKLRMEERNRRDTEYGNDEDTASTHCSDWLADSRKKALLADFGVGTIDQALLSVLPARHQSLRLFGLTGKVLIVDEVHACDCYMGELLSRLLRFHASLDGSAILLSATLPILQRARYFKAFAGGASIVEPHLQSLAYPLATKLSKNSLVEEAVPPRASVARSVAVQPLASLDDVEARLVGSVGRGRCAVWVRNSVADAIESWRDWNATHPQCPATLYHARFALCDRLEISKQLLRDFGPRSTHDSRRGQVIIATQVVEQSLDVDFDDMVSDLAPIDALIQRAGRLQRHRRDGYGNRISDESEDGRGGAMLNVFMPPPADDADERWIKTLLPRTGRVYPDHGKLWLTARWLTNAHGFDLSRTVDGMPVVRQMIEYVYDEEAFDRLPAGLHKVAGAADGSCRADVSTARSNLLVFDEGYDRANQRWEDDAKTPTRLSDIATLRVRLARFSDGVLQPWAQYGGGIDWALSELNVPEYLVSKESPRYEAVLADAREQMHDKGRYVVIVPLEVSGDEWLASAVDKNGNEVRVRYSAECGLSTERHDDEFDQ